jgi:tetraacyldisaccharide 4'-kinase
MNMHMPPTWMAPFLFVPGILWEAVLRIRNRLFESGMLTVHALPRPVISIGNMTLGGSGKTPLATHVARLVAQNAGTPVLLSRGYGRHSRRSCNIVPPDVPIALPACELGDEPALVRRSVPGVWLGIAADRFEAGIQIAARVSDAVFILDDGFQHRRLRRDLDLLVVDSTQPLESNLVFPRGSLREPVGELRRCHAVIINGGDGMDESPGGTIARIHPSARLFHCRQRIETTVPYPEWLAKRPAPGCCTGPVFLVAAIGNPLRFVRDVTVLGLEIRGSRFYRDHHTPRTEDWLACWGEARSSGARCLLTTEKDAIKIRKDPGVPLTVAVQSTRISENAAFEEMIRRAATA